MSAKGNVYFTKYGLKTSAKVGLFNVSYSYDPLGWLELTVNVPITVVDAHAKSLYVTSNSEGVAPVAGSIDDLDRAISDGVLIIRERTLNQLGANFNEGTSAGLGRVTLGGKATFAYSAYVDMAASLEVFLPSPSENEYAGTNSAAFLPRLIAAVKLIDTAKLHVDVGYDYDTQFDELSSFVWNTGASYGIPGFTVDAGVGGALFDKGIAWTPSQFTQTGIPDPSSQLPVHYTALADNTLGTNYVQFLCGAKLRLADNAVLSGAVNVPLNSEGIRPTAGGTLAFEVYF